MCAIALRAESHPTPGNLAALRSVLIGSPTYSQLVLGHTSDGSTAELIFTERPPGTSVEQKHVFGIYESDDMIGCIDAIRDWPDQGTCHIGLLLIDEQHQGRGIGRQAMRLLCDRIRQWHGITTLRIGVVASNAPAFQFWRTMGFDETGERKQNPAFASEVVIMTAPLLQATADTFAATSLDKLQTPNHETLN